MTRDGRSFAIRVVRAFQQGGIILVLTASFHISEPSTLCHRLRSPVDLVPAPEPAQTALPGKDANSVYHEIVKSAEIASSESEINPAAAWARYNGLHFLQSVSNDFVSRLMEFRYVSDGQIMSSDQTPDLTDHQQFIWFRANGSISDDRRSHAIALAYASDHDLLNSALRRHEKSARCEVKTMVSLNHVIYFHEV
jgi:acyl-CoA thioesterase II